MRKFYFSSMTRLTIILGLLIITALFLRAMQLTYQKENLAETLKKAAPQGTKEAELLQTLANRFVNRYNLLGDMIEGNQFPQNVLLESMEQLMEYAVMVKNEELFRVSWDATRKYMRSYNGYFYWRLGFKDLKADDATALIDDLRVMRSLARAAEEFGVPEFENEAKKLAGEIYKYNLEGCLFCDSYDGRIGVRENKISLFYIDPQALAIMASLDTIYREPVERVIRVLMEAPLDHHGFFPRYFDYRINQYSLSPEVNMVETLYTARMARDAGRNIIPTLSFIASEISTRGRINNIYTQEGKPMGDAESTAVYALAFRLLLEAKDIKNAEMCFKRMIDFQIPKGHPLQGCFGDVNSSTAFIFDQLEALFALHAGGESFIERGY